jgi:hypothetical protein
MHTNMTKRLIITAVALGLFTSAWAKDSLSSANFKSEFSSVSPLELPAKAAAIVGKAGDKEREAVTVAVVKSAFEVNATTSAAVVSSIARTSPEMAPAAAGTAAALQPKMAAAIARAAASAAPAQPEGIVFTVCKSVPAQYRSVALSVERSVPSAAREILRGLSSAVPALRPYLDQARSSILAAGGELTVSSVLAKSDSLIGSGGGPQVASLQSFSGAQPPPYLGPPYIPLTNGVVPPQITSTNSGEVTGPRPPDYSSP